LKKKLIIILLAGVLCLWGMAALAYNEAPMLRVKVAAGELPPVEKRLPEEPVIIEPLEEIGQYGGTLHVLHVNINPWNDMGSHPERGPYLLRVVKTKDGITVVPELAKGYKLSDDAKTFTLYLRKEMKWSDGYPFTADDFLFMYEDMHWNDKVPTWNMTGQIKRIKKIDDYTVRFEMDQPYPTIVLKFTMWAGSEWNAFHPKHYLKKWHIKYNPKADELAKKEGFDNWWDCLHYHYWWAPLKDLNKPTMYPWILKEVGTTYKVFERNPYYPVVDSAGNQLPYIDKIVATIIDPEVYQLKITSGEADVAYVHTSLENYPLYKENEEKGDYRVVPIPGIIGSELSLGINLNHPDPVRRKINEDIRFRKALSLAINREEINETCYFGLAFPRQATVLPDTSYYKEEWGKAYAQYDPDEAKRLLDEAGLTKRDKDGFRLRSDGKTLLLLVEYCPETHPMATSTLELVKEYWENVGLKVMLKPLGKTLFTQRYRSANHGILAGPSDCLDEITNITDWNLLGGATSCGYAWLTWLRAKQEIRMGRRTLKDYEGGVLPGEEPPEEIKKLDEWIRLRQQVEFGSEKYMELSRKIHSFNAEKIFVIGTVGMAPVPYITKKNIGNVPKAFAPHMTWAGDLGRFGQQLFFKQ